MLAGYFDESGLDEKSQTFCIGGYVADSKDWFELTKAWEKLLVEAGVSCFHMAEFDTRHGEFEDWTNAKRLGFIKDLLALINSTDVWGIGCGVVKADYERISADFAARGMVTPHWYRHPYLLAFQHCLIETCIQVEEVHPREKIAFVFDQQGEFHARAEMVYDELTSNGKWPRAFRLGSLRFASKRDAIPLQAADLLVYELRKRLDHKLFDPARSERRSMERVRRRLINPKYFDESALRTLVEQFDER